MKLKTFIFVSILWLSPSVQAAHTDSFSRLANATVEETWTRLGYYGLLRMNAWAPALPRPMVPALEAVVSRRVGLVAYYDEEIMPFGTVVVFKNLDSGQRHSISFNRETIHFLTPYAGTIAHANRYYTVGGPAVNYYCQSQPVTEFAFRNCIENLYINVIVNQLRPWGN